MKNLIVLLVCSLSFAGIVSSNVASRKLVDRDLRVKIANGIIEAFAKKDYDSVSTNFHSSLKQTLPKEKLREFWQKISAQMGKYVSIISTTHHIREGYNIVTLLCKFEKDNSNMELTFNQDNQVIGLYFYEPSGK